jgi:hypothetical protein
MSTTQNARSKFTIAKTQENLYSYSLGALVGALDTEKMGTVYNPFTSKPAVSDGAVSSTHLTSNYTADADSLEINRRVDASEQINSYDWKSVDFGLIADRSMQMGKQMAQVVDGYFLSRPVGNVTHALDAGDFGGTAGQAYGVSTTTVDDMINEALTRLHIADTTEKKWMAVSPNQFNALRGFLQATGNNVADNTLTNGLGSAVIPRGQFSGVDVFMTNNLTHEVVVTMATIPANGQTLNINGVVVTFLDTMAGVAGSVHIASTVDITRANLAAFINGTSFPGDTTVVEATDTGATALSVHNQAIWAGRRLTAVNDNAADTLTITARGTLVVSTNVTGATVGAASTFSIMGDYGSVALYIPSKGMDYTETKVAGKPGRELFTEQFYNSTVWTRHKDRIVTIKTAKA